MAADGSSALADADEPAAPRLGLGAALAVFGVLAVLRLLAGDFRYFFEEDDMSLANGIAAILQGEPGYYLYRYVPQIGYYRLMAFLTDVVGGVAVVPHVMVASSAIAGAAIPAATLLAFRRQLPDHVRLLAAAIVTCTPALWIASQYGNTAVVASAFTVLGLVMLSNRPGTLGTAIALTLCAVGVLVRADAVLMAPVVALLVFRAARTPRQALLTLAIGAVAFVALWFTLRAADPWTAVSAGGAVASHFQASDLVSRFWEHMLWAFSPIPLIFALFGAEALQRRDRDVFLTLAVWILPVFGFYYGAATTTRYFMLSVVPMGIFAACGVRALASRSGRRALAWPTALLALSLHLWVGLGHFRPADPRSVLTAPGYATDDGRMPTGALVYQGYHRDSGVLGPSLRRSAPWGARQPIAVAMDSELGRIDALSDDAGPARVVVLLDSWNAHVFHFHAFKAGAEFEGRDAGAMFLAPTHFSLNGRDIMTIGIPDGDFEALDRIAVEVGDEIWYVAPIEWELPETLASKLPPQRSVGATHSEADRQVRVYPIVEEGPR
ncbi:MAG: hypothetical protein KJO11_12890 [Gemmatimonadetes bacterium]|nr:hypothetical protein [Gemmatimonadota bacterium]NNF38803.1 hypothetical protein [Gemmatimonadota bacterium]